MRGMMKPNIYRILQEAVESGIELGYNRAYKHSDGELLTQGVLKQKIHEAVMNEICEWFVFDEFKD